MLNHQLQYNPDTKLTFYQKTVCFIDKALFNQTKTNKNIQVIVNRNDCIKNFSQFFFRLLFVIYQHMNREDGELFF